MKRRGFLGLIGAVTGGAVASTAIEGSLVDSARPENLQRVSLKDHIYDIRPHETPLLKGAKRSAHEWVVDKLDK